jgi:hypothetical protein
VVLAAFLFNPLLLEAISASFFLEHFEMNLDFRSDVVPAFPE